VLELIVGGLFTALGPVALSWTVSRRIGRREALKTAAEQLASINVNLGSLVGGLNTILRMADSRTASNEVLVAMSTQVLNGLKVQIDQIQRLVGRPFDGTSISSTLDELNEMGAKLERASQTNDTKKVAEVGSEIQKIIKSLQKKRDSRPNVAAECPNCSRSTQTPLGTDQGDTAFVNCAECGYQYNVHRQAGGTWSSKPLGFVTPKNIEVAGTTDGLPSTFNRSAPDFRAPTSEQLAVDCVNCGNEVKFRAPASFRGSKGTKSVVCFACDMGLKVDGEMSVTKTSPFTRRDVEVINKDSRGYHCVCPECSNDFVAFIRMDDLHLGLCRTDSMILRIPPGAILAWHEANA
jgi:Zn ribbon nucleic-acid-binding protein